MGPFDRLTSPAIYILIYLLMYILIYKLSPVNHMEHWNFVLVQKDSNAKKRNILLQGTLKVVYQIYH